MDPLEGLREELEARTVVGFVPRSHISMLLSVWSFVYLAHMFKVLLMSSCVLLDDYGSLGLGVALMMVFV